MGSEKKSSLTPPKEAHSGKQERRKIFGNASKKSARKKNQDFPKHKSEVDELRDLLSSLNLTRDSKNQKLGMVEKIDRKISNSMDFFIKAERAKDSKSLSNSLFSRISPLGENHKKQLASAIESSDLKILAETYANISTSISLIASIIIMIAFASWARITNVEFSIIFVLLGTVIFIAAFLIVFTIMYLYPFQKMNEKRRSIDTNLPFAINHMAAIASAGVPPEKAFEMLAEYTEYGSVSSEAKNVVQRIDVFGEDITMAIKEVASKTPSKNFKDLLFGLLSVIESGGNLKDYLNEMAEMALFEYKLARKKYIETLSTYADLYTAILIAAPLFLVAILTVMNIIPGSLVGGISIESVMKIGVYIAIPALNIIFMAFVSFTQPEI